MIRITIAAAALLLAGTAASAQSFYPNSFGSRYCELRRLGVAQAEAINLAIDENWSNSRPKQFVTIDGKRENLDTLDAVSFISSICPQYLPR